MTTSKLKFAGVVGLKKPLLSKTNCIFLIQDSQKSSTLTEIEGKKFYLGTLDPGTEKKNTETNKRRNETSGGSHPWLFWSRLVERSPTTFPKHQVSTILTIPKRSQQTQNCQVMVFDSFPKNHGDFPLVFRGVTFFVFCSADVLFASKMLKTRCFWLKVITC